MIIQPSKGNLKTFFVSSAIIIFDFLYRGGKKGWRWSLFSLLRSCWEGISSSEIYTIVSHIDYTRANSSSSFVQLGDVRKGYAANAVILRRDNEQVLEEISLPPLYLYYHENVSVRHGSDHVLLHDERIIMNDFCAANMDENRVYTDESTWAHRRQVIIMQKKKGQSNSIDSGIRITGKFSRNYYHDIYEHLIRLLPLSRTGEMIPPDVPFIVDEEIANIPSLHRIYELLTMDTGRATVFLHHDEWMDVKKLYYISDINYLVPEHIDPTKGCLKDYIFDKEYTLLLRNSLLRFKDEEVFAKRIFVTRKGTNHRRINENELFAVLEPLGFVSVAPELLSIEQQMALFHGAEWIVGGPGAAFTNLLFASPDCTIICPVSYTDYIPPVFSAPACFNEASLVYYMSKKGAEKYDPHADFSIDACDFQEFVSGFIPQLV